MAKKFVKLKRITMMLTVAVVLLSMFNGCAFVNRHEFAELANSGVTIEILLGDDGQHERVGEVQSLEALRWEQLDQLSTHNKGFRQDFDQLLNIDPVREGDENGKQGCLYVGIDGHRDGNGTLLTAFMNRKFVEKYWQDEQVIDGMGDLCIEEFGVSDTLPEEERVCQSLIAYFDLLPMADQDDYIADQSLTRSQFFTLLARAEMPVSDEVKSNDVFEAQCGADVTNKFVAQTLKNGYLSTGCVDRQVLDGSVTKLEVIHTLVTRYFVDILEQEDGKTKLDGITNGGNLEKKYRLTFEDEASGEMQEYTTTDLVLLKIMCEETKGKVSDDVYKVFCTAQKLGITTDFSDYNESVTAAEAMKLIINAYRAMANTRGYFTEVEYGEVTVTKLTQETKDNYTVTDDDPAFEQEESQPHQEAQIPLDEAREVFHMCMDDKGFIESELGTSLTDDEFDTYLDDLAENLGYLREELEKSPTPAPTKAPTQPQPVVTEEPYEIPEYLRNVTITGTTGEVVPSKVTGTPFKGQ